MMMLFSSWWWSLLAALMFNHQQCAASAAFVVPSTDDVRTATATMTKIRTIRTTASSLPPPPRRRPSWSIITPMMTRNDATTKTTVLTPPGVADFEAWQDRTEGFVVDERIQHALFRRGLLRGLQWIGSDSENSNSKTTVARIPQSIVLSSNYQSDNWDRDLALQLWKECCRQGDSSKYVGYCRLLTEGVPAGGKSWGENDDVVPPSTAPHSIRHWNNEQRDVLSATKSQAAQALLDLEDKQEASWRQKYESISSQLTWPQFQWAMEAVHSRAFCGVQTTTSTAAASALPGVLAPVVAAAAGYAYFISTPFPSEIVLALLAVTAVLPTLYQLVAQPEEKSATSAVLLPLIDSANHLEQADSTIDFDPIKNLFLLSLGPKCFVKEDDETTQVYISYGNKGDPELLLKYGFLPGVPQHEDADKYRRDLAAEFIRRNTDP